MNKTFYIYFNFYHNISIFNHNYFTISYIKSDIQFRVCFLLFTDSPRSTLTVTPDSPVFTETVNLICVIESHRDWRWRNYQTDDWYYDWTPEWRYEWYKDSVMLQSSDRYTVNRDTLTIRGATESDQGQYWCRGQRDERPQSSQSSSAVSLTVEGELNINVLKNSVTRPVV